MPCALSEPLIPADDPAARAQPLQKHLSPVIHLSDGQPILPGQTLPENWTQFLAEQVTATLAQIIFCPGVTPSLIS